MILCRSCKRRSSDETVTCECGADLRGRDGIALSAPAPISESSEPRYEPVPLDDLPPLPREPDPPPSTVREPSLEPVADLDESLPEDTGTSASPTTGSSGPRRGVRPGERRDEPGAEADEHLVPDSAPPDDPIASNAPTAEPDTADVHDPAEHAAPAALTTVAPVARTAPLGPEELACPRCRRANAETRRFCAYCAATMPAFDGDLDDERDRPGDPWWRRVMGTTRGGGFDNRTFAQRMRDSGQRKLTYRAKYTLQSRLRSAGIVVGGAGGLMLMLGPVRARVVEQLSPPEAVRVTAVELDESSVVVSDEFRAALAHDDNRSTAMAVAWTDESEVSFVIRIPTGADPRTLEFVSGFPNDDLERGSLFLRPSELRVEADGRVDEFTLDDHAEPQRVDIDVPRSATEMTITVVSVHQQERWTTYDRVAIAEVAVVD